MKISLDDCYFTDETTAALSITPPAAEEKEDGPAATDEEDGKEEEEVEAVQQLPRQVVRILPPVEMMVENEIWQYRYPPFDDIFNIKPSDEDLHDDGRLGRLEHQDVLPSYVIGILDPAELVEGLFSSSQRASASSSSSSAEGGSRNSVSTPIEFPGPVNPADEHIIRIGKSLISHQDDDRWVWPTVS